MRTLVVLFLLTFILAVPLVAQQSSAVDVGLAYNFVRANVPPGVCACFSMNGGSVSAAWQLRPQLALVGDVGAVHAGSIFSEGYDLTLTTFLFGPRFYVPRRKNRSEQSVHAPVPFVQVLFGGAHASGTLSGTRSGSSNGFAFSAGGGLDVGISRHVAARLFQTEYLFTHIPNGVNDHQNNFRFSSGIVVRFGG
jgi:outer membrane immunogenic protein